jgi:hypothetical protein
LCLAYLISPVIAWKNQRRLEDSCPPGEPRLAEFWRQTSRPEPNAAARRFEALSVEAGIDVAPKDIPGRPHLDSRRVKEVAADREVLRTYWDERRLRADDEWMEPPLSLRSRIETPAFQAGREFLLGAGPLLWEFDHEKGEARPLVDLLGLLTWTRLLGLDALESARRGDYRRAAGSLEAAWKLRDAMAERPQTISAAIALVVEQEIESVLRLLGAPPALWVDRLRSCDHEASVAKALRGEVLFWVGFRTRLARETVDVEMDLQRVKAAERLRDSLTAETTRIEEDVARLRHLLPEKTDADAFVAALARAASREQIDVVENGRRTGRKDDLLETVISISFFGAVERARAVANAKDPSPLHTFQEDSSSASHLLGHFTVWAWPEAAATLAPAEKPLDPWLWPLTRTLDKPRRELAALERKRKRNDARLVMEAVERFEALKLICEQLEDRTEELRITQSPGR